MSTIDQPEPRVLPPLIAGQRLDQPTFHERYEAMPPGTWAELVGGIVYMPSPLRNDHGETDLSISYWIGHYKRFTRGLRGGTNVTTILGGPREVQPDQQLRIPVELGGLTRLVDGYVTGPPELVVEVARSSKPFDLGVKKGDYERAGVPEYLFIGLEPEEVRWFVRRGGRFAELPPDPDGIYRSEVFPGLWLDAKALFDDDLDRLIAVLDQGLATPEHAAFVARLAEADSKGLTS
jgi:Uma2 family endonuclease